MHYTLLDGSIMIYADFEMGNLIPFNDLALFAANAKTDVLQTMQRGHLAIADPVPEDAALEYSQIGRGYIYMNLQPAQGVTRFINYGQWLQIIETLIDYNNDWWTQDELDGSPIANTVFVGADKEKIAWGLLGYDHEPYGSRDPDHVTFPSHNKTS